MNRIFERTLGGQKIFEKIYQNIFQRVYKFDKMYYYLTPWYSKHINADNFIVKRNGLNFLFKSLIKKAVTSIKKVKFFRFILLKMYLKFKSIISKRYGLDDSQLNS
jgi:hypothetical protein